MKLRIAQVHEDKFQTASAFYDFSEVIDQWSHQESLRLKIDQRNLVIFYGMYEIYFYSKEQWIQQSAGAGTMLILIFQ